MGGGVDVFVSTTPACSIAHLYAALSLSRSALRLCMALPSASTYTAPCTARSCRSPRSSESFFVITPDLLKWFMRWIPFACAYSDGRKRPERQSRCHDVSVMVSSSHSSQPRSKRTVRSVAGASPILKTSVSGTGIISMARGSCAGTAKKSGVAIGFLTIRR